MSISKTINWNFNILYLTNQRAHNCYDVRTLKFFPPAECWLVNSNFRRASRMQGTACTHKIEGFDNNVNKQHQMEQSLYSNNLSQCCYVVRQSDQDQESWSTCDKPTLRCTKHSIFWVRWQRQHQQRRNGHKTVTKGWHLEYKEI